MNQTQKTWAIILRLSPLFRRRCWLCHDQCKTGKYFLIHHREYKKGEKTYKDFLGRRLAYYQYLEPIVRKEPKRFRLLHASCHTAVTRLHQWSKPNRKRLIILANELP